jgi:hypothetical protein
VSLPTYAIFYKENKKVGAGFCNIGWFIDYNNIRRTIKEAMENAWKRYSKNFEYEKRDIRLDECFTTAEDLKQFDEMHLYGKIFPRWVCLGIYFDKFTLEEFDECLIECGVFTREQIERIHAERKKYNIKTRNEID